MEHIWFQEVSTTLINLQSRGEKIMTLFSPFEFLCQPLVHPIIAALLVMMLYGMVIGINYGAKLVVGIRTAITMIAIALYGEEVFNPNLPAV